MPVFLKFSRGIDALNEWIAGRVIWLVLIVTLISAGNAVVRKIFNTSSNSLLEIQWYLFSAVFLLCAGYTLLRNEHVRIDVVASRFSRRTQIWVDILGTLIALLPMAIIIGALAWPEVVESYERHEISGDAGGLLR